MVNYQNGKIYKIVCNITGEVYVGSTTLELSQRLADHRMDYGKFLKGKHMYMTSFDIIERGDCDIVLLEKVPCNSRAELLQRERHYFDTIECINRLKPYVSEEEATEKRYSWNNAHIELVRQYKAKYRRENQQTLNERARERKYDKKKQQQRHDYYLQTIDHKKEYDKNRYENHKIVCECGSNYIALGCLVKQHEKTKKHQAYLEERAAYLVEHV
jgi:hypothetical protein